MKKIWIALLLLTSGQIYSSVGEQEEKEAHSPTRSTSWFTHMINKHGESFTDRIRTFEADTQRYMFEPDKEIADDLYEQLIENYNPRILNQAERELYDDFYRELQARHVWKIFSTEVALVNSEPSFERFKQKHAALVEKYSQAPSDMNRPVRLRILDMALERRRDLELRRNMDMAFENNEEFLPIEEFAAPENDLRFNDVD